MSKKYNKQMVSARVPEYVVSYVKSHGVPYADLVMAGFDKFRENDVKHAEERLRYHEERLMFWKQKLLIFENKCNTSIKMCNTVKEIFHEQGRGSSETRRFDINWLKPKVRDLQDQGVFISVKELYNICIGDK